jgi:hypothetical protein
MIYSKLKPIIKDKLTNIYESEVLSYIMLTKPYHTKLKDIVVNFKFVEQVSVIVDEIGQPAKKIIPSLDSNLVDNFDVTVSDNILTTIDFIMDYAKTEFDIDYNTPLKLSDKYKKPEFGYALIPFGHEHLAASYDNASIGDHYDMDNPTHDYTQNNNATTIKTSITERLVIDATRTLNLGFDTFTYDNDKFDTIDTTGIPLPPAKVFIHSECGDESFVWGGLDTDIFHKFFTDLDGDTLELPRTLPPFDTDIFEKMFKG